MHLSSARSRSFVYRRRFLFEWALKIWLLPDFQDALQKWLDVFFFFLVCLKRDIKIVKNINLFLQYHLCFFHLLTFQLCILSFASSSSFAYSRRLVFEWALLDLWILPPAQHKLAYDLLSLPAVEWCSSPETEQLNAHGTR